MGTINLHFGCFKTEITCEGCEPLFNFLSEKKGPLLLITSVVLLILTLLVEYNQIPSLSSDLDPGLSNRLIGAGMILTSFAFLIGLIETLKLYKCLSCYGSITTEGSLNDSRY